MKPKPKWQLKVLFIFIEMRLSKKVIPEPKWQLKVLFIFLELRLFKTVIKTDKRILLWNQSQNDSWKFFSSSLKCNFQKRSLKETIDFCSQIKPRQFDSCLYCKAKQKWRSFHFIELWLSKIATLELESKAKITYESSLQFIGLRLNSSHNRNSMD